MKNRYDKLLLKHNQEILNLVPYNPILFKITAEEIKSRSKKNTRVLEIGCGEGNSALPILSSTKLSIDLLDQSPEMLRLSKNNLKKFKLRTNFICQDALDFLNKNHSYDIIFSSWTVHNFKKVDREELFKSIYKSLNKNGTFILADKIYPPKNWKILLTIQGRRFKRYLSPQVANAIIKHEKEDASDTYRIDEVFINKQLKKIGFKKIEIIDRVERDAILIAHK